MAGFYDDMGAEAPEIQALLDTGYALLDGYDASRKLSAAEQARDHAYIESYIEYLANDCRHTPLQADEYDVRWYAYLYFIRSSGQTPAIGVWMLASLRRFTDYLEADHGYTPPAWLNSLLSDRDYFLERSAAYQALDQLPEPARDDAFDAWCDELKMDLDARVLWAPNEIGQGMRWGQSSGWREALLQEEAHRQWQAERTNLLSSGLDYEGVRERLLSEYSLWLETPQERLEGSTPLEVIREERILTPSGDYETDDESLDDEFDAGADS